MAKANAVSPSSNGADELGGASGSIIGDQSPADAGENENENDDM